MLQIHNLSTLNQLPELRDEMFRDRKKQFFDRLKWEVRVDSDDREIDSYDDQSVQYLVYVSSTGSHLGSLRIGECSGPCMIKDHFHSEFPQAANFGERELEITRFCTSPKLYQRNAMTVSNRLMRGAFFNAFERKCVQKIIGICYRPMLRIYKRAGMSPTSVEFGRKDCELVLTRWHVSPRNFSNKILASKEKVAPPRRENSDVPLDL